MIVIPSEEAALNPLSARKVPGARLRCRGALSRTDRIVVRDTIEKNVRLLLFLHLSTSRPEETGIAPLMLVLNDQPSTRFQTRAKGLFQGRGDSLFQVGDDGLFQNRGDGLSQITVGGRFVIEERSI
eukprot:181897-Prymnesium_polylepis.1